MADDKSNIPLWVSLVLVAIAIWTLMTMFAVMGIHGKVYRGEIQVQCK